MPSKTATIALWFLLTASVTLANHYLTTRTASRPRKPTNVHAQLAASRLMSSDSRTGFGAPYFATAIIARPNRSVVVT